MRQAVALEVDLCGGGRATEGVVARVLEIGLEDNYVPARQHVRGVHFRPGFEVAIQALHNGPATVQGSPAAQDAGGGVGVGVQQEFVSLAAVYLLCGGPEVAGAGLRETAGLVVGEPRRLQQRASASFSLAWLRRLLTVPTGTPRMAAISS